VGASDGTSNESCTVSVVVRDVSKPTFTFVPGDMTVSTCVAPNFGQAIATDNCSTPIVTNDAPSKFPLGVTTTVTWTATDAAGNVEHAPQRITTVLGDDPSCCPTGTNIIVGTDNAESISGTNGSDCILGRGVSHPQTA